MTEAHDVIVPPPIRHMPGADAVGKRFVIFDALLNGEVLGTVAEYFPDKGPVWRIELDLPELGHTSIYVGPDASSNIGRWHVVRTADHAIDQLFEALAEVAPYPPGTEPVPARIVGPAFFPGGSGLWRQPGTRTLPSLPVGAIMVVGQDFHSKRQYERSLCGGQENLESPTWRRVRELLRAMDLAEEACFFTNAFMGLRQSARSTGEYAGARDPGFVERCRTFLVRQLSMQRPRVVVALGLPAVRMLGALAPTQLAAWCEAESFRALDDASAAVVPDVRFERTADVTAHAVALVHPSYAHVNARLRRYRARSGENLEGADAELAMLNDALEALAADRWV